MRDSFVLYTNISEVLEALSMEQRGMLFTAIIEYQKSGEMPEISDPLVKVAFIPVRQSLDINNDKYDSKVEARRQAGIKSGESRRKQNEQEGTKRTNVNFVRTKQTKRTENDNDNENVYENENVNVNEYEKQLEIKKKEKTNITNKTHTIRKRVYVDDERLNTAIHNFVDHRQKMRKPMTDYAIQLFIKKLNDLSGSVDGQIQLIDYAISKGWQTVYPINEKPQNKMDAKLAEIDSWV